LQWDQLKLVLAISRSGSLSAAASSLGVNQSTVSRRLQALEKFLGIKLFMRTGMKLAPTESGETFLFHAERMESEFLALMGDIQSKAHKPRGPVRLSTMPWIITYLIVPALSSFREQHPEIFLQAISGLRERSLGKREAELSLRFELQPRAHESALEIANVSYSVYRAKESADTELPWLGYLDDAVSTKPQRWTEKNLGGDEAVAFQANDAGIVYHAVRRGLGKALLPDILGRDDPLLVLDTQYEARVTRVLNVLVHEDMKSVARVATVIEWLKSLDIN
jgi:DNA-binding transcriptional LysR family regulator